MSIKYKGNPPTEDGWYLVRCTTPKQRWDGNTLKWNDDPEASESNLYVVEADVYQGSVSWSQAGADYDVWTHDGTCVYELEVVVRLDLEAIERAARAQV